MRVVARTSRRREVVGSDRVDKSQGRSRSHAGDLCLIAIKQTPVFGPGHAFNPPPPNAELSLTTGRTQIHREQTRSYPLVEDRHITITAITDHYSTTIIRAPVILAYSSINAFRPDSILADLSGRASEGAEHPGATLRSFAHRL